MCELNRILVGDCRDTLAELPAGLFHAVVTSPPYWGLRTYLASGSDGVDREIGREAALEQFTAALVDVFQAVRRVLRDDGTLWVNLGDGYGSQGATSRQTLTAKRKGHNRPDPPAQRLAGDEGCQLLMPHRFALAMIAAGWCLRSTVIWHKASPTPEALSGWHWTRCRIKVAGKMNHSGKSADGRNGMPPQGATLTRAGRNNPDLYGAKWAPCPGCPKCQPHGGFVLKRGKWRPTTAHEYLFQFTKGGQYFGDGDAAKVPQSAGTLRRFKNVVQRVVGRKLGDPDQVRANAGFHQGTAQAIVGGKNPRSVWKLPHEPYQQAHFATYPTKLVRPCIESSTSAGGCCPACGAPYAPVIERERHATSTGRNTKTTGDRLVKKDDGRHVTIKAIVGYWPTCDCPPAQAVPCRVLDPFGGSGTTAQVARALGRDWVLCELNPEYVELAQARIDTLPRWARDKSDRPAVKSAAGQRKLF